MYHIGMKTNDKRTLTAILNHKNYFDQKLIEMIQNLRVENEHFSEIVIEKKSCIVDLKQKITDCSHLLADSQKENEILQMKKKEADDQVRKFEELLRKMQEELEEIRKENNANLVEIGKLQKEAEKNKKEIERQKKIINKLQGVNSTNSNMPSSSDVLSHTVPEEKKHINTRKKSKLSRGGQKGHTAHVSSLSSSADTVEEVRVKKAPSGAEAVRDEKGNILYYRTQEIDFVMSGKIRETRYYIDHDNGEDLSAKIMKTYRINPVAYTPGFKSAMIYMNHKGTVPLNRLTEILKDLSDNKIDVKPSSIVSWEKEFLKSGERIQEKILSDIKEGKVVHVDETSVKINTEQYWLHTISNERGIFYTVTENRCDKETGPLDKLKNYPNILVHDHLKSYYTLTECQHAECNAHIQRYLQSGMDFEESEACKQVLEILQRSLHRKHELQEMGYTRMPEEEVSRISAEIQEIMNTEMERYAQEHPCIKKKYEAEYIKLFRRMMAYMDNHLLFLRDFDVPYTNNEAERCCRKVKTKKNVSHQFVSADGVKAYAGIMTVIETARRKKENPLKEIEKIMSR